MGFRARRKKLPQRIDYKGEKKFEIFSKFCDCDLRGRRMGKRTICFRPLFELGGANYFNVAAIMEGTANFRDKERGLV